MPDEGMPPGICSREWVNNGSDVENNIMNKQIHFTANLLLDCSLALPLY